jgi:DNA-binding Lrp family transcriptional regulator
MAYSGPGSGQLRPSRARIAPRGFLQGRELRGGELLLDHLDHVVAPAHRRAQVRHRIKALTEDGLLRVAAIMNPFGTHFQVMAWLGVRVQPGGSAVELSRAGGDIGAVTYVINTAGRYDALIEVACADEKEFLSILDQLRALPGAGRIEAYLYLSVQYRPLLPL